MGTPEAWIATVSAQVASVARSMDMILPNDGLKPPVADKRYRRDTTAALAILTIATGQESRNCRACFVV